MTDEIPPRDPERRPLPDGGSETPEDFTRWKAKVQVGDGPDCRATVTVETTRKAGNEDAGFADWYTEMERSLRAARKQLGLPEPDPNYEEKHE